MRVADAAVPFEGDAFRRRLLRELAAALEEVVGLEEAAGYIGLVGQRIGDDVSDRYLEETGLERLDRGQVVDVLIDFERRIQGDFHLVSEDEERIVLGNRCCPFGDGVRGVESLCTMTSSLLGNITARHLGYAKVELVETIARRHPACRVVIHLRRDSTAEQARGDEYFGEAASPAGNAPSADGSPPDAVPVPGPTC
ncbi:methanogen output domain 1-containing protein [Actinorugispora endophytica]|uniref:Metanogen output domain-containing protein n=1 Tax=Actinorugispora endophytica TaxID=1605990 RepID=A0A4R6UYL5_9ACTN|nr:methanogen output domain 1-containing protein [Actinorugispora endophytica]TDQ51406.1 hypothetical protein EV190_11110 [Actinorugispora endophytica]